MTLELWLGLIILAVLIGGGWAIMQVLTVTFNDWNMDQDVVDEVEQEAEFLRAVQRAARQ